MRRRAESATAAQPATPDLLLIAVDLRPGTNRLLIKTFASRAGRIAVDMPEARFDRERVADDLFRRFWEDFAESDWFAQDAPGHRPGGYDAVRDFAWYFAAGRNADAERQMICRVLDEVGSAGAKLARSLDALVKSRCDVENPGWLALYVDACRLRRQARLRPLERQCPQLIFTRHTTMGGSHYAYTEGQSDAQAERHFVPGSSLCRATSTTVSRRRDAAGRSRRYDSRSRRRLRRPARALRLEEIGPPDDYHLYEMDLASRSIRQLTFGLGVADYEGVYLPGGDILFNSTRCVQTVDCWWTEVSNLYSL